MYKIIGCKKKFKYFDLIDFDVLNISKRTIKLDMRKKRDKENLIKILRLKNRSKHKKRRILYFESNQTILTKFIPFFKDSNIKIKQKKTRKREFYKNARKYPKIRRIYINPYQLTLDDFNGFKCSIKCKFLKRSHYRILPDKQNVLDDSLNLLPEDEKSACRYSKQFRGYLKHLFLLNDYSYFDKIQKSMNIQIQKSNFTFSDIIKCEIARCKLGLDKYSVFLEILNSWDELKSNIGIRYKKIPTIKHYIELLKYIGPNNIYKYFTELRGQCMRYKLYSNKISIWDAHFYKTYFNGTTKKQEDVDRYTEVKPYVKFGKTIGVGVLESNIVDWLFGLPIYYDSFTANTNDNIIFRKTFNDYMKQKLPKPDILLSDGGPKGFESHETVLKHNVTPIIAAPENAAGKIIKTKKNRLFYSDYIPRKFYLILDDLFDNRTTIERKYGYDILTYNRFKAPNRIINLEKTFIGIHNCCELINALTAYKLGKIDLIRSPSAFRKVYNQNKYIKNNIEVQNQLASITEQSIFMKEKAKICI